MAHPPHPSRRHRQDPKRVVWLRTEKGFNQKDLAAKVGISPAQMCRIETGNSGASVEVLHKIAAILGCEVAALMPPVEHVEQVEAANS